MSKIKTGLKTIADFKRKVKVGVEVRTEIYRLIEGEYILLFEHPRRSISIVQSNSYAFATFKEGIGMVDGWADWPKKGELSPVDDVTVNIVTQNMKVIIKFL